MLCVVFVDFFFCVGCDPKTTITLLRINVFSCPESSAERSWPEMSAIISRSHFKMPWDFSWYFYEQIRIDQKWHCADLLVLNILAASSFPAQRLWEVEIWCWLFKPAGSTHAHRQARRCTHTHIQRREKKNGGGGGTEGDNREIFSIKVRSPSSCLNASATLTSTTSFSWPPAERFKLTGHGGRQWAEHNSTNMTTTMHGVKCQFK